MNTTIISVLKEGKIILYPTDTVWGIGCDATNFKAVEQVYRVKERQESKSLIVLVNSIEMLQQYIRKIPEEALNILKTSNSPTTIIYNNPTGLAKNTIAKDNTIAIRLVKNSFCEALIKEFGKPIVSTSANISGEPTPISFNAVSENIKKYIDYIVKVDETTLNKKPSTILKIMEDGSIKTLRI